MFAWLGLLQAAGLAIALPLHAGAGPARGDQVHFRYRVYYLGMRAGELQFAAHDSSVGERTLRVVRVRMKTGTLASALFRVENDYRVVYNPSRLRVLQMEKRIRQRNLAGRWILTYEDGVATLRRRDGSQVVGTWKVKGPVLEVISTLDVLIRTRCPDSTFTLPVDEEGVPMEASVRVFRKAKARFASAIFRPVGESRRRWKTDILTNRFSKPGAVLQVRFGKDRPEIPEEIRYSLGPATATAKLVQVRK